MNRADRNSLLLFLGAFLWGVFVLAGYYLVHKPASPQAAMSLMQAALDVGLAIGITGLAGGLGRRLFTASTPNPLVRFALQAALGWGILGLLWFSFGIAGLFRTWFGWLFLVGSWEVFHREIRAWFSELNVLKAAILSARKFEQLLWLGIGLLVVWQAFYALAPPVKWDTLAYHLELPKQYLAEGRFLFLVDNPLWGRSQIVEVLYTWAMSLRGMETATMLAWCFGVVFIVGVFGYVQQLVSASAGVVAVTAIMAGYTFRGMLSWGYVDALVALYGLAVLVLSLSAEEFPEKEWFTWVGVFCGLALGVKFTAGLLLPVVFLSIFLVPSLRSHWWKYTVAVIFWALLIFLPWLLKNGLTTGNPLYPHIWPTPWINAERLAFYQGSSSLTSLSWQDAWLPLAATWLGLEGAAIDGIDKFFADVGPLLVLLAIPGLLFYLRKLNVQIVVLWLGIGWITMILGGVITPLLWQTRYFYCLLPAAGLAAGWGWEMIGSIEFQGSRLEFIFKALILIVLGLMLWQDGVEFSRLNPLGVALGSRTKEAYLDDALGWYSPAMRALQGLPEDSRVIFLWEERGLYAPPGTEADQLIDNWYVMRRTIGDPDSIRSYWLSKGFTHVLVYQSGAEFEREHKQQFENSDWSSLDALLSSLAPQQSFGNVYELYRLTQ